MTHSFFDRFSGPARGLCLALSLGASCLPLDVAHGSSNPEGFHPDDLTRLRQTHACQ